ncbi:efflux RND transporter permease subunit [Bacillus horti]|uniref:HAE1 family hydrophobic/amphiphilic exporter-1 n=1 Tax=Caldalkalibacillus horti TaxID=77523 RepID=A0ABT9VZI8_9BACI|nr:efflux RND transporter permease subunit [Bacillus horti]MDQ0166265.1 HAE1 family hydrophobic/amphiphilic exporter-1 [Bacillus horti]
MIPKYAVRNPVTTIMMMLLVLLLGFVSFTNLKLDLFPNINPPVVAVLTTYQGAGPEEVAEMVTKPLEETIGTSAGLETLQSRSSSNSSLIIAQYAWGTDVSEIREDLSTSIGLVPLPDGVDQPIIVKFDPTMMPVMQFSVSNGESIAELQETVERVIVTQLQNVEGVASVSVAGGFEEEISVALNEESLNEYDLTQDRIVQLIQGNNLTYPGGVIEEEGEKLSFRILAQVETIEALRELPVSIVPTENGMNIVTLAEVADVELTQKELSSIARTNGRESLLVSVQKEGTANTVDVSNGVLDRLDEIRDSHSDLRFSISNDQGDIIKLSISNVSQALIFGAIFAIAIILLFLRSASSTFIVAISIPFSVVATFVLMYFSGMSLNIMSLGGLALGVGMLVDNAIVVIENINRHLAKAESRRKAVIDATVEVGGAISASTFSTLAVFLPIVFVGGLIGDLFKELALTVAFSLLASLVVALTVVPSLAALLLKEGKTRESKENKFYKNVITWVLDHRLLTLFLAAIVLAGSLFLVPQIGTEFMPSQDEGMFTVDIELPEGASFERTLEVVEEIEQEVLRMTDIDVVTASVGNPDAMMAAVTGGGENEGSITVKLVPRDDRSRSTGRVMAELQDRVEDLKDRAELTFHESNSMEQMSGATNSIEVLVLGEDKEQVAEYAQGLSDQLADESEIRTVSDSLEDGRPEYQFIVDKNAAFEYGLTSYQIATFINESLRGQVAAMVFDTEVRVHMAEINQSQESIENLVMSTPTGQEVTVGELGEVVRGEGPVTVVRENQQDSVIVTATFDGTDMGTVAMHVQRVIDDYIDDVNMDTNLYSIKISGGVEMMNEAFSSLFLALVLAIIFSYMVMASLFESLLQPFIIMFTLPLAVTGVILGLFLTDYAFGVTAFIGIIILVGIVVNNAIVFIDYANKLREKGFAVRQALIEAGLTRLRPIVMTAISTILGLIPLAIGGGEGAEMQAPMAIAVIGGLFTSTLLTLIVIPVIYSLISSMKGMRQKWKLAMERYNEIEDEFESKKSE